MGVRATPRGTQRLLPRHVLGDAIAKRSLSFAEPPICRRCATTRQPAGVVAYGATLEAAGIDRATVYITNAVKHFKNEPRGKRRLHKKPDASEIEACRWWLDQEIALVRPRLTVALGATAAGALMRRTVTIGRVRGQAIESESGHLWITVHPSYLLRLPDEASRQREFVRFVKDLEGAKALLASRGKRTS